MPRRAGIGGLGGGLGVAGLQARQAAKERAEDAGGYLHEQTRRQMMHKCETLKQKLETFAKQHKHEIVKNPEFRSRFNAMCSAIGVDPLNSNKGMWGALGMGDFYYELGVQLIEVCLSQRARTGGIDSTDDVLSLLQKRRGPRAQPIAMEDLERAVRSISELGKGIEIISVGGKRMVQSVPLELSHDHTAVLELARTKGFASVPLLMEGLQWHQQRAVAAVDFLIQEGVGWVDSQAGGEWPNVWFPAVMSRGSL